MLILSRIGWRSDYTLISNFSIVAFLVCLPFQNTLKNISLPCALGLVFVECVLKYPHWDIRLLELHFRQLHRFSLALHGQTLNHSVIK